MLLKFGQNARLSAHCFSADKYYFTLSEKRQLAAEFNETYFDFNGGKNVVTWVLNGDLVQFLRELATVTDSRPVKTQLILAVGEKTEDKVNKLQHQFANLPAAYWPSKDIDVFVLYAHSEDHFWGIGNKFGAEVFDNCPELVSISRTDDVYTTSQVKVTELWTKFVEHRSHAEMVCANGRIVENHPFI